MPKIDVSAKDLKVVLRILQAHAPECEVWAFGSRVAKTAKKFSDLDLVLMTPRPLEAMRFIELKEAFSESDLPFRVDVLDWSGVNEKFREIIRHNYVIVQKAAPDSDKA